MKIIYNGQIREKINRLPIKSKISLSFVMIFFIFLFSAITIVNIISSKIIIKKTIQNFNQNLNLVLEKIDITFDGLENYTKIALINRDVQETLRLTRKRRVDFDEARRIQQAIVSVIEPKTNIDNMLIFQANGNIVEAKNSNKLEYTDTLLKNYFDRINSSKGKIYWLGTHKSLYRRVSQEIDIISLLRAVIDSNNGRNIGIIETCIEERHIASLFSNVNVGKGGEIFIINRDGYIISHKNKELLYSKIDSLPYFNWILNNDGVGKTFKIDKQDYLVVGKQYKRVDWIIVGTAPISEITADSSAFTKTIFLVGFACMLLFIVIIEFISLNITKPIEKLKQAIEYVGQGDFQAKVDIDSKDEIGMLAEEFNKMVTKTSDLLDRVYFEQTQKREFELALIQSQINPHFLYNTLENICGLAELKRNDDIIEVVNELALFYRGVLSKGSNIITIAEEIKISERYLKVLKLRYGERLEYEFDIDEKIGGYLTVKLLLQPIVENSIYHGLKNRKGKGNIKVKGILKDNNIILEVIDNGVGIKSEDLERILDNNVKKEKSFGLKSINERIKLYFGDAYGISLFSIYGEGTRVRIVLPAKSMEV